MLLWATSLNHNWVHCWHFKEEVYLVTLQSPRALGCFSHRKARLSFIWVLFHGLPVDIQRPFAFEKVYNKPICIASFMTLEMLLSIYRRVQFPYSLSVRGVLMGGKGRETGEVEAEEHFRVHKVFLFIHTYRSLLTAFSRSSDAGLILRDWKYWLNFLTVLQGGGGGGSLWQSSCQCHVHTSDPAPC